MIAIVDYGAGNLSNVKNMLDSLGVSSIITSDPREIDSAERVILPGVGAFGYLMEQLRAKGLDRAILKHIHAEKPFLGVCLGVQALFEESEESPGCKGLGVFSGKVVKFRCGKVPHMGWNLAEPAQQVPINAGYAYFVHSFHPAPEDGSIIMFRTDYGGLFCSGVRKKKIIGVQFHPERSGAWGRMFYQKWIGGELDG